MDPQAALDAFNNLRTPRAERVELVDGLYGWLCAGGFKPDGFLNSILVRSLWDHGEYDAHSTAIRINELLKEEK